MTHTQFKALVIVAAASLFSACGGASSSATITGGDNVNESTTALKAAVSFSLAIAAGELHIDPSSLEDLPCYGSNKTTITQDSAPGFDEAYAIYIDECTQNNERTHGPLDLHKNNLGATEDGTAYFVFAGSNNELFHTEFFDPQDQKVYVSKLFGTEMAEFIGDEFILTTNGEFALITQDAGLTRGDVAREVITEAVGSNNFLVELYADVTVYHSDLTTSCAPEEEFSIVTEAAMNGRFSDDDNDDELPLSGGLLSMEKNGDRVATLSITNTGHIRVTAGGTSQTFSSEDLEIRCGI